MIAVLLLLLTAAAWAGEPDSLWVTTRVDLLNVGYIGQEHHTWICAAPYRDWPYTQGKGLGTPLPARECICRVCLRHEWQGWEARPKSPPEPTEFEKLKAQLVGSTRWVGTANFLAYVDSAEIVGYKDTALVHWVRVRLVAAPVTARRWADSVSVADPDCVRAMVERLVP